jgi:hypothetical protein
MCLSKTFIGRFLIILLITELFLTSLDSNKLNIKIKDLFYNLAIIQGSSSLLSFSVIKHKIEYKLFKNKKLYLYLYILRSIFNRWNTKTLRLFLNFIWITFTQFRFFLRSGKQITCYVEEFTFRYCNLIVWAWSLNELTQSF